MPFLFLMVLPTMMWDTLMLPPRQNAPRKKASRRASLPEPSSEPWGRLTP